jgi:transcription initiation factor TFIIIB Brf1 subunit/transcription initiation factor TFIIB
MIYKNTTHEVVNLKDIECFAKISKKNNIEKKITTTCSDDDNDSDSDSEDLMEFMTLESTNDIDHNKIISGMKHIMDAFNTDNDIFPLNQDKLSITEINYKMCPKCNIACKIYDIFIICERCGMEREWDMHTSNAYNMTIDQNYNTSNNSFMTFSIIGVNAYYYNRSFLKTCADYSAYRNNNNKKEIINKIDQYEGNKPPHNIINATADLFDQIKNKGYVYRGDGKLGVIAACLYYASIMNNLTRSPKEIAAIMGIDDKFLSQGDRILQELNELNVISIPTHYKPLNDYLNQFFPALGIPDKYKQFVTDIIARAERKHLHIRNESRTTTKIVGVIYLLTQRVPELKHIKNDEISKECNKISKSTFIKYSTLITDNYKIMKKPFRKHKIKQPASWKD